MRPDPADLAVPPVAAVCVYPNLVAAAKRPRLERGQGPASVATAFPSGQSPIEIKVAEARAVVELGADEVDMVIDRGAFLSGRYARVYDGDRPREGGVRRRPPQGDPRDGRAGACDNVRRAALLAIAAGAASREDVHGQGPPPATLPVTLCMMEVVRDVHSETGHKVGIQARRRDPDVEAGGQKYLVCTKRSGQWMTPDLFRFGASSLLNDVLMQVRKERTGRYQSGDYFTID